MPDRIEKVPQRAFVELLVLLVKLIVYYTYQTAVGSITKAVGHGQDYQLRIQTYYKKYTKKSKTNVKKLIFEF